MSEKLLEMLSYIPGVRLQAQSLRELDLWKATELRQFLQYTAPVMLGAFLDVNMDSNLMLLFSSIAILVSPRLSCHPQFAATLLTSFVCHFGEIYGLVHQTDEIQQHGRLDSFSEFPYKSYLHKLKKIVFNFPLAQIIRRLSEMKIADCLLINGTS